MAVLFQPIKRLADDNPWGFVLILSGVMTLLRLILLAFYQSSLGPDEAQYWFWGQHFDWGYYSKPPMIAWVIAVPTTLFGDQEWSLRLLSPALLGGTALFIFGAGRSLFGDRVGLWAAALWLVMPAVMLGATLITTDIPLLFFWSLALWAFAHLCSPLTGREAIVWANLLGAALGLGFLSKYAMIYFPIGMIISFVISPYARRAWQGGRLLWAVPLFLLLFSPNLFWNASHGFQTLSHTVDNADWQGYLLNPEELLQFLGDQFGVVGPLLFAALLFGLATWHRRAPTGGRANLLAAFVVPPLVIISIQALISRAHANWAVAAYPAALILITHWMLTLRARWVLWGSLLLHSALGLFATLVFLNFDLADRLGRSNDVKRLRGWEETSAQIAEAAKGYDAVVVDEREFAAHLTWEWREQRITLYAADLNGHPDNSYEYAFPFQPRPSASYLLATQVRDVRCAYPAFHEVMSVGSSFVDLKATRRGRKERTIDLYRLGGYDPLYRPADCPAK